MSKKMYSETDAKQLLTTSTNMDVWLMGFQSGLNQDYESPFEPKEWVEQKKETPNLNRCNSLWFKGRVAGSNYIDTHIASIASILRQWQKDENNEETEK